MEVTVVSSRSYDNEEDVSISHKVFEKHTTAKECFKRLIMEDSGEVPDQYIEDALMDGFYEGMYVYLQIQQCLVSK